MSELFKCLLWITFVFSATGCALEIFSRQSTGDLSRMPLEAMKGIEATLAIGFLALIYQREKQK